MKKINSILLLAGIFTLPLQATTIPFSSSPAVTQQESQAKNKKTKVFLKKEIECPPGSFSFYVKVTSPNGGEVWDRNKVQRISWTIAVPEKCFFPSTDENKKEGYQKPAVSIDLYKKVFLKSCKIEKEEEKAKEKCLPLSYSVFVKHLATVSAWKGSWEWKIDNDVPNGDNYVIRVTPVGIVFGSTTPNETSTEKKVGEWNPWDESDNTFVIITGNTVPMPSLEKAIARLEAIKTELQNTLQKVLEVIKTLKELELAVSVPAGQ